MHEEREDDVSAQRHRRIGHEPVAAHLRDEPANPRPELDALGVELERTELLRLSPFWLLNDSFWTYFCRFRSASPSDPPGGGCICGCCIIARRSCSAVSELRGVRLRRRRGAGSGGRARARAALVRPRLDALGELPRAYGSGLRGTRRRARPFAPCDRYPTARRAQAGAAPAGPAAAARRRIARALVLLGRRHDRPAPAVDRAGTAATKQATPATIATCTPTDTTTPSRRLMAPPTGSKSV